MTLHFIGKVVRFLNGVHCFVHKTNLVVVTLCKLDLVRQLEGILQALYAFFTHKPKKFMEFQKLV